MKPIFRMGLFLSFLGKVYRPIFYTSHQWKLRKTEIVQSVGVDSSPGDWFYFIITEENRNLLSLKKWRNWNFPAKVDIFPSFSPPEKLFYWLSRVGERHNFVHIISWQIKQPNSDGGGEGKFAQKYI